MQLAGSAEDLYNESFGAEGGRKIELLTEAVRLCPEEARFRVALGDAYMEPDIEAYQAALAAGPQQPAPSLEEIRRMLAAEMDHSVPHIPASPLDPEQMAGLSPERLAEIRRQLDCLHPKPRDPARALDVYREAASACPDSPLPHFRLAEALRESDPPAAVRHLESAAALDPENALPLYELALLAFQSGDTALARTHLEAARTRKGIELPVLRPTRALSPLTAVGALAWGAAATFPDFARMRALAREIVRLAGEALATGPAGAEDASALVQDGELLAARVMRARPRQMMAVILGVALQRMMAQVDLPRESTPTARRREQSDRLARLPGKLRLALQALTLLQLGHAFNLDVPTAPWEDEEALVDQLLDEADQASQS